MSTYIELEIQNLLKESPELVRVADRLISYLDSDPHNLTQENVTALCRFLLNANLYSVLVSFVQRSLDNENFPIPWPYFFEALGRLSFTANEKTLRALLEGLGETDETKEASRSQLLAEQIPELRSWREQRRLAIQQNYWSEKQALLDQLITLRTQQLYSQEKKVLAQLQKRYPEDKDVQKEVLDHRQRYALEVLQKYAPKAGTIKISEYLQKDAAVDAASNALMASLKEHAATLPDMALDFAIVAHVLDAPETALELLSLSPNADVNVWFRIEFLLKGKHFVDLLSELSKAEMLFSHDPETFFATAYYRAQALWGLGQKHTAIEVLEGLLASRPHYRAASALLSIWSSQ